jgi:hypothetical protein
VARGTKLDASDLVDSKNKLLYKTVDEVNDQGGRIAVLEDKFCYTLEEMNKTIEELQEFVRNHKAKMKLLSGAWVYIWAVLIIIIANLVRLTSSWLYKLLGG